MIELTFKAALILASCQGDAGLGVIYQKHYTVMCVTRHLLAIKCEIIAAIYKVSQMTLA